MKAMQYLTDEKGITQAVQLPISEWNKLVSRLNKYEQMLMLKKDLTKALAEVKKIQNGKLKKQSLQDFLNEL